MRRIIVLFACLALITSLAGGSAFVFAQSGPDPMTNRFAPSSIHSLDALAPGNSLAAANRASQQDDTEPLEPSNRTLGCSDTDGNNVRANQECTNVSRGDLLGRGQAQNETVAAVDPNDPHNVLFGQNDYRNGDGSCGFDYSRQGGALFGDGRVPDVRDGARGGARGAPRRRGRAHSSARPGGAALRGGLRARGVPPLLGGAVDERRGAGPRPRAALAARRAHARAGLRPGAARASRRREPAAGCSPRTGRPTPWRPPRQRAPQRRSRSRRWCATGRRRRRFSSAPRSSSCSPPTSSTSSATCDQLLDLLPRLVDERGRILAGRSRARPGRALPGERARRLRGDHHDEPPLPAGGDSPAARQVREREVELAGEGLAERGGSRGDSSRSARG